MKSKESFNVLVIPTWFPSKGKPLHGISVLEHIKAISLFNKVAVLYLEMDNNLKRKKYLITISQIDKIKIIRIKYRKTKFAFFLKLVLYIKGIKFLISSGFRIDIIHAHVYYAGFFAVILGKIFRIPVIVTEHSSSIPLRKLNLINQFIMRYTFRQASFVCPVSLDLANSIKDYGVKAKFRVIPNTVNSDLFFSPEDKVVRATKIILFVGSLQPIKGLEFLIYALYNLRKKRQDFVLKIIGDGPYKFNYENLTEELGLSEIVEFCGIKSKEKVAEIMRYSDFLVLPSLYETQGCVIIEAMASGLPVVATEVGGVPELITPLTGILVKPGDVYSLEKAVEFMLDNHQAYSKSEISQYALRKYGYYTVGKKFTSVFKEVLK